MRLPGTIVAVGENVRDRTVGQRVTASICRDRMPSSGPCLPRAHGRFPVGLAWPRRPRCRSHSGPPIIALITKGQLQDTETVLIQAAAGGVGLAAVQLARKAGANVIAVASGSERQARLERAWRIPCHQSSGADVTDEVLRLTGGRGADLVIDPVGSTLQASLSALAPEGRLVFVGNAGGGGLNVELWQPMQNNQTLHGVFMGALFERPAVHDTVHALLKAAAEKRLEVVIDRTFALRDASLAHGHAETARPLGRVVMKP